MPTASSFPACCGVNIISGIPYDDDLETDDEWSKQELANIVTEMPAAEGTYCHCHLIALTPRQTKAAEIITTLGYEAIGHFKSCDGPYQVTLYANGLDLIPQFEVVKVKKKKAKKKQVRRKRR
jgi:hypothetical protein